MVPGAIRRRITKLWQFWVNLVIIGEFPPISRFWAENALFRTFRENPCSSHLPGRGRGVRSLNKQNPETALPHPGLPRLGPGEGTGGPEQGTGGPEQWWWPRARAHSARSLNVLLRGGVRSHPQTPGYREHPCGKCPKPDSNDLLRHY